MPNNIDPLAYEERLTKAGVPAGQAHVHAEAIGQVKDELDELEDKIKSNGNESLIKDGLSQLNTKIDRTKVELEAKIDSTKAELEAKIEKSKAELEKKIQRAKVETICWTVGIVLSVCTFQGYVIVNMLK